jgi:hypothetical protein
MGAKVVIADVSDERGEALAREVVAGSLYVPTDCMDEDAIAKAVKAASGRFDTKKEAVERSRELANKQKGRLVVHKQDGTIQEERTYRKDPYPPKG